MLTLAWIPSIDFPVRLFSRLLSGKPGAVQIVEMRYLHGNGTRLLPGVLRCIASITVPSDTMDCFV